MKSKWFSIAMVMMACSSMAQNVATKEVSGGFLAPESVGAYGKHLYVSNMGSQIDPTAKDGDGYISRLSRKDGKMEDEKFITGLNSPKGIKIAGGVLFVADVDKVIAYRIKTKKKIWEADFSSLGVNYLNDIAIRGWASIFVSATDKNAVYKVSQRRIKQLPVKGDIPGANGLYHPATGKLFIANYGKDRKPDGSFGVINLVTKKYKPIEAGGMYDGIQRVCGKLVISDWVSKGEHTGKLFTYKVCKKKLTEIKLDKAIPGPSDIYVDRRMKVLWIPCMLDNKLVSIPLKGLGK